MRKDDKFFRFFCDKFLILSFCFPDNHHRIYDFFIVPANVDICFEEIEVGKEFKSETLTTQKPPKRHHSITSGKLNFK